MEIKEEEYRKREEAYKKMLKEEEERQNRIIKANEILNAALATYGLQKGQHVASHERIDPRTGQKFKAGKGGTGSPKTVLGEGKTVAPVNVLDKMGDRVGDGSSADLMNIADIVPKGDIDNPDMLETVIRNLELATVAEIEAMANDAFTLPESRTRGRLAELILKEILRRGLVEKNEIEKQMGKMQESADASSGWNK